MSVVMMLKIVYDDCNIDVYGRAGGDGVDYINSDEMIVLMVILMMVKILR